MTSACPKCTAGIDIDVANLSDADYAVTCQECKTRLLISREPFAARAIRKKQEINCARCGGELGHAIHCPGCGQLYPEYFVTETAESRRRKQRQRRWAAIRELNFSFGSASVPASTGGYSPERQQTVVKDSSNAKTLVAVFIGLVLVIALSIGGIKIYKQHQQERKYAFFFTKTLYGIKSGADYSLVISEKIITESKEKGTLRLSAGYEAGLSKIKGVADHCMQELKEPPKKYADANERVQKVYSAYVKLHSTVLAPTGTPQSFSEAVAQSDAEFKSASKELKGNLPDDLAQELKAATTKYKALRDL